MTTIAYRNGVMASDSRAYSGDKFPIGSKKKIHRLKDGSLLGISSTIVGLPERFVAYVESDHKRELAKELPVDPHLSAILVRPSGAIFYYAGWLWTGPIDCDYIAAGSGEQYALTAMELGFGPEAAVAVAIKLDVWSSLPIQALTLDPERDLFDGSAEEVSEPTEPSISQSENVVHLAERLQAEADGDLRDKDPSG